MFPVVVVVHRIFIPVVVLHKLGVFEGYPMAVDYPDFLIYNPTIFPAIIH